MKKRLARASTLLLNRRRLVWALIILLCLTLLTICAWLYADAKTDSYKKAMTAWRQDHRPPLLQSISQPPKNLFVLADHETVNKRILDEQTTACRSIATELERSKAHAEALPILNQMPVLWVNAAYREAASESHDRRQAVEQLYQEAQTVYVDMAADCQWSNEVASQRFDLETAKARASKQLVANGARDGALVCQSPGGCLPSDPKQAKAYAASYEKSLLQESAIIIAAFGEPCQQTSIAQLCGTYQAAWKTYQAKQRAYVKAINQASKMTDNAAIEKAHTALIEDKSQAAIFAAVLKQVPALKNQTNVTKDTLAPETIFRTQTLREFAELKKQSSAVKKL